MYRRTDIRSDIARVLGQHEENDAQVIDPDVVTEMVLSGWGNIEGDHADAFLCAANLYVRNEVRQQMNRYKLKEEEEPDSQLVLEGFERLQKWYLVEQHGKPRAITVEAMTDDQLYEKAQELKRMGDGCYQHAAEIYRFVEQREKEPQQEMTEV